MSPCDSLRCISRIAAESSSVDKDADNKSRSVLRPLLFTAHISPIAGIAHLHNIDQQSVVKVDRRIRRHYTTTILRLRIGARLSRYQNCKFHNFVRTISRYADGISRYSVPPSAGPLLPLSTVIGR